MITVTLTTDWGTDGFYTGAFKGRLVSRIPGVQLVDISHQIDSLQPMKAAMALQNSYQFFMAKTIHVVSVGGNLGEVQPTKHICFLYKNHYFIGPNNGIWEMIFNEIPAPVFELPSEISNKGFNAFPELEIYINALGKLAMGMQPNHLGDEIACKIGRKISSPCQMPDSLHGEIVFFDTYGNAITNITQREFEMARKNRPFTILAGSMRKETTTNEISKSYSSSQRKDSIIALFSFSGYLELAVSDRRFNTYFAHIDKNTKVTVQFFNSEEERNSNWEL